MEKEPNILTEINGISTLLASLKNENVFTVPEWYFDTFPSLMSDKVHTFSFDEGKKPAAAGYKVPDGYFDNLSNAVLAKIRKNDTEETAKENQTYPVLSGIKKDNSLSVPPGYFDHLPQQILEKVKNPAPVFPISGSKVVPLFRRPSIRYAMAAAVLVLIFAGIFFRFSGVQSSDSFAVVNKKTVPQKAALQYNTESAFEEGIASLSDDQIIAYLQNHGNILDNGQLISNTNLSKMPDPLDYLADENTLDNYLRGLSN